MNGASASAAEYSWELRLCQALGGIKGKREREREEKTPAPPQEGYSLRDPMGPY